MTGVQTIQICRPSAVVAQQILELGEAWLEDAVRTATSTEWCLGPAHPGLNSEVHLRFRLSCGTRQQFRLPMEWELVSTAGSTLLRGELEVVPTGPSEARIKVNMALPPELIPAQESERAQLERSVEIATRLFLQRLFWTLQALTYYDLLGQRASGATAVTDGSSETGAGRSGARQGFSAVAPRRSGPGY